MTTYPPYPDIPAESTEQTYDAPDTFPLTLPLPQPVSLPYQDNGRIYQWWVTAYSTRSSYIGWRTKRYNDIMPFPPNADNADWISYWQAACWYMHTGSPPSTPPFGDDYWSSIMPPAEWPHEHVYVFMSGTAPAPWVSGGIVQNYDAIEEFRADKDYWLTLRLYPDAEPFDYQIQTHVQGPYYWGYYGDYVYRYDASYLEYGVRFELLEYIRTMPRYYLGIVPLLAPLSLLGSMMLLSAPPARPPKKQ